MGYKYVQESKKDKGARVSPILNQIWIWGMFQLCFEWV